MSGAGRPLTVDYLVHALLRRRWLVLTTFVLTPLAAMFAHALAPHTYEASARVLVEEQRSVNPFLGDLAVDWTVKQRTPLIQSVLKSHETLEHVLKQLKLIDGRSSPEEIDRQVEDFERRIEVIGLGGGLVKIKVRERSPKLVYEAVALLVRRFVSEMLRPQKEAVEASAAFLEKQMTRLRTEVNRLEADLTGLKSEHATGLPQQHQMNMQEHLGLRRALVEAEVRLESRVRQLKVLGERLVRLNPVAREFERKLVEARSAQLESETRYVASDVHVLLARARVSQLQAALAKEESLPRDAKPADAVTGEPTFDAAGREVFASEAIAYKMMEADAAAARGEVEVLKRQLAESDRALRTDAQSEADLNRVQRELDIKLDIYRDLLGKYEDALVTKELSLFDEQDQVWTVEAPKFPTQSLKPSRPLVGIGAALVGILLGLVLAAVAEAFDDRLRTPEEAAALAGSGTLGRLPRDDELT